MSITFALLLVGGIDLLVGWLFWWLHKRSTGLLRSWPDPGPWGEEKQRWDQIRDTAENMRVVRVVCINTGASMICTGLLLLTGAPI